MGLRDMAQRDARRLVRMDDNEAILYKFKATGSTCQIPAIVNRSRISRSSTAGGRSSHAPITIMIAAADVPSPQIGDLVQLPARQGIAPEWQQVSEIIPASESGMHRLGIGR